jgi:hypothetical protein
MAKKAVYIGTISHIDPNSNMGVDMETFIDSESGGMIAIDSSYLEANEVEKIANPFNSGKLILNFDISPAKVDRQKIIDSTIKDAIDSGDYTVIEELLQKLPSCYLANSADNI